MGKRNLSFFIPLSFEFTAIGAHVRAFSQFPPKTKTRTIRSFAELLRVVYETDRWTRNERNEKWENQTKRAPPLSLVPPPPHTLIFADVRPRRKNERWTRSTSCKRFTANDEWMSCRVLLIARIIIVVGSHKYRRFMNGGVQRLAIPISLAKYIAALSARGSIYGHWWQNVTDCAVAQMGAFVFRFCFSFSHGYDFRFIFAVEVGFHRLRSAYCAIIVRMAGNTIPTACVGFDYVAMERIYFRRTQMKLLRPIVIRIQSNRLQTTLRGFIGLSFPELISLDR